MPKSKIIFLIGGIRSGKSAFAIKLAKNQRRGNSTIYIATALKTDREMKERIIEHRKLRPKRWQTIEEAIEINKIIGRLKNCVVIIDCVGFWVSNLLTKKYTASKIFSSVKESLNTIKKSNITAILVSNEIGLSPVTPYKSGRIFQDILGKVNQIVSNYADEVYFFIAGIPIKLK